jgi:hypothetical protein
MFNYYAERINDVDADGNVLAAVVKWSQEAEGSWDELMQFLHIIAVSAIIAFGVAQAESPYAETIAIIGCGLVGLGVLVACFSARLCTVHCELLFESDGCIWEPRPGWRGWLWGPWTYGDYRNINSIQIEEAEEVPPEPGKPAPHRLKRYEVWIYFNDGDSSRVAFCLLKRQAHQVAVLMDQCRLAMRDAEQQAALQSNHAWVEAAIE